jgi:hypothetical protein
VSGAGVSYFISISLLEVLLYQCCSSQPFLTLTAEMAFMETEMKYLLEWV